MKIIGRVLRATAVAGVLAVFGGCGDDDGPVGPAEVAGTWEGSTSQEREIAFIVTNGEIAQGSFSYALQGSGCPSATGAIVIQGGAAVPIQGGEFTFPRTQIGANAFLVAEGKFTSATSASGTFSIESGACEISVTWTATKQ
jgi:hypothetical protein